MANRLTYISLCVVLEHLDANKRFHIVSRSPQLQQFEKSIPLFLEYLCIQEDSIGINDVHYSIRKNDDVDYWLGGRREIYVDRVRFNADFRGVLRLPVNLQLKIKKLDSHINDFRRFLPIISPDSFPLKKLRIEIRNEDILNHVSLKSAEKLGLYMMDERMRRWFLEHYQEEFVNKTITIYDGKFEIEEVMKIIQRIIKYRREVGRCFRMKRISLDRSQDIDRAIVSEFDVHRLDGYNYIRINDSLRLVCFVYERGNDPFVNIQFEIELVDQDQSLDDTPNVRAPPEPMLPQIRENKQRWKLILMICIPVLILLLAKLFGS